MAEGDNGRLEMKVGDKSIGVTSRDLISVLLIMVSGLGGYFVATQVTLNQRAGLVHLSTLDQKLEQYQARMVELVHTNRQQMAEELKTQNALLQQQTAVLTQEVDGQTLTIGLRFDRLEHRLSLLNYNIHHDVSEQLPLEGQLPPR
jgi:hypothetical protein